MPLDYIIEYYNDLTRRQPSITSVLYPTYHFQAKDDDAALRSSLQHLKYLREVADHPYLFYSLSRGSDLTNRHILDVSRDAIDRMYYSRREAKFEPGAFKYIADGIDYHYDRPRA
jgi:hypothetical protein